MTKDLRYAFRSLLKHPSFAAIAILTVALGIGANTAIFSIVNTVMLSPLPFPEQDQLVRLGEGGRGQEDVERGSFSFPDFQDLKAQTQTFSHVAAYLNAGAMVYGDGQDSERIFGGDVTAEYFDVLGVKPLLGRTFTAAEDKQDAGVVLISYGLWQRRFNGVADVVGKKIQMGASAPTIIGVMPKGFEYPFRSDHQDFWEPLNDRPLAGSENRDNRSYRVIARMKPGVTIAQTRADLDAISRRLEQQYPQSNTSTLIGAASLGEDLVRDSRPALLILLGAVTFVLLIACANVANLLLARASGRQREIALRTALGASRWRVVRQLLVESLLLSFAGGSLGLLFAIWLSRLLVTFGPANIPRVDQVHLDFRVLGFTFVLSLVTGVAFGLVPALQLSRADVIGWLKEGARGSSAGPRRNLARSFLVISEVALSLMLLVGAGLLLKSFVRLLNTDKGFDSTHVVAFDIPLSRVRYNTEDKQEQFFERLAEKTRALPGVESSAVVNNLLLSNMVDVVVFNVAGRDPYPLGAMPESHITVASPEYFPTMKIPLERGRLLADTDKKNTQPVMVVSDSFVSHYFAHEDPIGLRLILDPQTPPIEIVGVVGDARREALDTAAAPEFYLPFAQAPARRMNLVVRSKTEDPLSVVGSVRGVLAEIDREQTVWQTRTLDSLVSASIADRRFNLWLLGAFAAIALVLALLGIYGVMTYSVRQRTHEIGIRMALGARAVDVLRLVIGNGMLLAVIGVGFGLIGAFALSRLLTTLLFEVKATDVMTYATVAIGLQLVALVACYIPARRATKVDPLIALRYE
ncbi:MAG TPA: ABC transporter permease [Pyrinomonadaceae bacterium]